MTRGVRLFTRVPRLFFVDWGRAADDIAAILRSEAGRNPHDRALVYTAAPDTPTADALKLLASWSVTQDNLDQKQLANEPSSPSMKE